MCPCSYFTAVSGTSLYESWVYTGFNFILGLPIIFYGFLDRDISEEFALAHPQVGIYCSLCTSSTCSLIGTNSVAFLDKLQTYKTGRTNVALTTTALGIWILNAILYAIIVCLIFYYAVAPTFEEMGLYVAGTTVFVGLCMSLQAKVAFFHHQWAWPQILVMTISVLGMLLYFLMIAVSFSDYYFVAQRVYASGIFWLFGMFFMPIVAIFIDWIGYYGKMVLMPTDEMLYREIEHEEEFNSLNNLTCIRGPASTPLSSEQISEQLGIDAYYPAATAGGVNSQKSSPSSPVSYQSSSKKQSLSVVEL